jgi:hypothetical protein
MDRVSASARESITHRGTDQHLQDRDTHGKTQAIVEMPNPRTSTKAGDTHTTQK